MKWETDLTKDIRVHTSHDDREDEYALMEKYKEIYPELMQDKTVFNQYSGRECTECNKESLVEKFDLVKDRCRSILEIGVCRNGTDSFVHALLSNKKKETIYIGVDLDDKTYLDDPENNIFTIQENSSNYEKIIEKCKELGVEEFDFIFIDGLHTVNQLLLDWEYTNYLSDYGIVAFHDTSHHAGPYMFINHIDTEKWQVIVNDCPEDYGIGYVTKKGNYPC
jgi:hypothetical protein